MLFVLLVDPGHLLPACDGAAEEGDEHGRDGEGGGSHSHQAGEEEMERQKKKEAGGLDEEAALEVLVRDRQVVLHVARKLKDTPEDDPGCQKEARPDPDDKADDVKAKPDESEDGGESAEDDDDDPAVDEAEGDPEPAAPARKDLLVPALILASPRLLGKQAVGRPLDWFQSTCAKGFEKLVNPLPVREDPVLLFYIIHDEISEEHIYQLTLLNYQLLECSFSNDVN